MSKYLQCTNSHGIIGNVWTSIRNTGLNTLKYSLAILLLVSLKGCEKQPEFKRLKGISGNYTISKATFLKADNVTDSISYSNFGLISFVDCKKNSTRSCTGEYKIGNEVSVSIRTSYEIGTENNILQLGPGQTPPKGGWQLFSRYRILEETENRLILQSENVIYFNTRTSGRVVLELNK